MEIENVLNEISKLPYVIQNDKIKNDSVCIRVNDDNVTDEMYENGCYITQKFIKQVKADATNIVKSKMGALADFLKVNVIHQDKEWLEVKIEMK